MKLQQTWQLLSGKLASNKVADEEGISLLGYSDKYPSPTAKLIELEFQ
jgi:hypothetical protein